MIITIRNQWLIRLAWGRRRVTSSTRYGVVGSPYPSYVTAGHRLWLTWFRQGLVDRAKRKPPSIVIHPSKATQRIASAVAGAEFVAKIPGLSDAEIHKLEQRRQVLRAEKKFQEADAIRDILRENGVDVMDGKVS